MRILPPFTLVIGILLIILQAVGALSGGRLLTTSICYDGDGGTVTRTVLECVSFIQALKLNQEVLLAKYAIYILTGVLGIYAFRNMDAGSMISITGAMLAFGAGMLSFASMGLFSKVQSTADTYFAQVDVENPLSSYWWVYLIDIIVAFAAFGYCVIWYYWHDVIGLGRTPPSSNNLNEPLYKEMPGR